jgi:hypothetical protein
MPDIVSAPLILRVQCRDVQRLRLLAIMRMRRGGIQMKMLHLLALKRAARDHALDSLFQHAFRVFGVQALLDRATLDAAGIASVVIKYLLLRLVAGQVDLVGVHHDDVVAAIDMRRELRLVLAAQAVRDDDGEASENDAFCIDQDPALRHLRRFDGLCALEHGFYKHPMVQKARVMGL